MRLPRPAIEDLIERMITGLDVLDGNSDMDSAADGRLLSVALSPTMCHPVPLPKVDAKIAEGRA